MPFLLLVLSAGQRTPNHQTSQFQWGQGQPQELDKALAHYNSISKGDRGALLHTFAREYTIVRLRRVRWSGQNNACEIPFDFKRKSLSSAKGDADKFEA